MITVKNADRLGPRKVAGADKPAPPEPPREDPMAGVMRGLTDALAGIAAELRREREPVSVPAPQVTVQIPDRPRKWLFKVNRNARGEIADIAAEALE